MENSHVKAFEKKHLTSTEKIKAYAPGFTGKMMGTGSDAQHNGALIVTSERVVFYRNGWFGEVIDSIPIKNISSVDRKSMLGFRTIEFHTSNNSLRFTSSDKGAEDGVLAAIDAQRATDRPPNGSTKAPHKATPGASADHAELLHQLGELRDAGILTEDEFVAKKKEILARI
jgi:hypothetical protein